MPAHSERQKIQLTPKFEGSGLLSDWAGESVAHSLRNLTRAPADSPDTRSLRKCPAPFKFRRDRDLLTFGVSGHLTSVTAVGLSLRSCQFPFPNRITSHFIWRVLFNKHSFSDCCSLAKQVDNGYNIFQNGFHDSYVTFSDDSLSFKMGKDWVWPRNHPLLTLIC